MLCKRLIPCLDVKDGRVVKGVQFVALRDAGDPVEAALAYDAQGADELVFLDITASHEGRATMLDVVRRTAEGIYMPLTVGGGIRSLEDIRTLLGITVLMVEHDMSLVSAVSDRVLALNYGRVVACGTAREVQEHPDVIKAYLGG